jgi:hypothetical protein
MKGAAVECHGRDDSTAISAGSGGEWGSLQPARS